MLLFARPELHSKINAALPGLLQVPFQFEGLGSQIVFYQQETFISRSDLWIERHDSGEAPEQSLGRWKRNAA